jgi:hypothetical protein
MADWEIFAPMAKRIIGCDTKCVASKNTNLPSPDLYIHFVQPQMQLSF